MEVLLKNEQQLHSNPRMEMQKLNMRSFSAIRIILVRMVASIPL
jgi:hypothetical protein